MSSLNKSFSDMTNEELKLYISKQEQVIKEEQYHRMRAEDIICTLKEHLDKEECQDIREVKDFLNKLVNGDDNPRFSSKEEIKNVDEEAMQNYTALTSSINSFAMSHQNYLKYVLLILKDCFIEKTDNYYLKRHFFSHLKIDKLIELHTELDKDFEILKFDHKRIGSIFKNLEKKFLVYVEIVAKMETLLNLQKEEFDFKPEIQKAVFQLEHNSKPRNKDRFSLSDLLQSIPHHVMKYNKVVYFGEIKKQAQKASATQVEKETSDAIERMENFLKHMNKYDRDYSKILEIDKIEKQYHVHDSLKQFGTLRGPIPEVAKVIIGSRTFQPQKVYIFEEAIVVIANLNENNCSDFKMFPFELKYGFEVRNDAQNRIIEMNTYNRSTAKLWKEKSLKIQFTNRITSHEAQNKTYEEIKELCTAADTYEYVQGGSNHRNHKFKIHRNLITEIHRKEDHIKCQDCQKYLAGKIFKGIYCFDCDAYYHIECFKREEKEKRFIKSRLSHLFGKKDDCSDSSETETESDMKQEDFDIGKKSNDEAIELLEQKKEGTFLVRYSTRMESYYLYCKGEKGLRIHQTIIHGEELFYIIQGFAYNSILDLVTDNMTKYNLQYAFYSQESDQGPDSE